MARSKLFPLFWRICFITNKNHRKLHFWKKIKTTASYYARIKHWFDWSPINFYKTWRFTPSRTKLKGIMHISFKVIDSGEVEKSWKIPAKTYVLWNSKLLVKAFVNITSFLEVDHPFAIDSRSGLIYTRATVDREKREHYNLTVTATDRGVVSWWTLLETYSTVAGQISAELFGIILHTSKLDLVEGLWQFRYNKI